MIPLILLDKGDLFPDLPTWLNATIIVGCIFGAIFVIIGAFWFFTEGLNDLQNWREQRAWERSERYRRSNNT